MGIRAMFDQKRRWRRYKAGRDRLPTGHRDALHAVERYVMYYGAISNGDVVVAMLEDLLDLFGQSAADGTSVRSVVGLDPVEFAEEFVRNYSQGQWIAKERARLVAEIDRVAEQEEPS